MFGIRMLVCCQEARGILMVHYTSVFFCTSAVANVHVWSTHVSFGCPFTQFYSLNGLLQLKQLLFIYTLKTVGAFSAPQRNKAGIPTSNLPSLLLLAG